jgi:hypothetical protein
LLAAFGAVPGAAQAVSSLEAEALLLASDNPFLLAGEDNGALAAELRLNPEIKWTLPPATTLELSGSGAYRRYSRRYGDFVTGRALASVNHRENESVSYGAVASFSRDLPVDALTESIDFTADSRTIRERWMARANVRWTPDSLTTFTAGGSWEELRYPDSTILSSTTAYQVDLGASRRVNPTTAIGVAARATQTELAGTGGLSASGVFATVAHRFGPHLEGNGQLGVEWTDFDLADSKRARVSGSGNLCYRPQLTELCVNASLQSEVSGLGGLQRELHAGFNARKQLGERGEVSGLAEYRRAQVETLGLQSEAIRLNMTYRHRLGERLSVVGGVDYLARKFLSAARNDAVMVRIGVTIEGLG